MTVTTIMTVILFAVLLTLHLMLLSVFIYLLVKDYQKLKKDFTSVVYQLIVLQPLILSLLTYSVRKYNGLINWYSFILGFAQISPFYADLPTDMTVYPQEYTLNCIKTGYDKYDITVSFQSDVVVVQGTGCTRYKPCNGIELHFRNKTYDHRTNITWDGETISSELFNHSATGDHDYECIVEVTNEPIRRRNVTIQGNIIFIA